MTDSLLTLTDRPDHAATMQALALDVSDITTEFAGTRLNVRLDSKWVTTGRDIGVDQGYREYRLRVTAMDGGVNQEELEAVFEVLNKYQDTPHGCGLYAEIQNNGLEISFVA